MVFLQLLGTWATALSCFLEAQRPGCWMILFTHFCHFARESMPGDSERQRSSAEMLRLDLWTQHFDSRKMKVPRCWKRCCYVLLKLLPTCDRCRVPFVTACSENVVWSCLIKEAWMILRHAVLHYLRVWPRSLARSLQTPNCHWLLWGRPSSCTHITRVSDGKWSRDCMAQQG